MTTARSVTQLAFDNEYRRIEKQRNWEIVLLAVLDFISAVSTALVLIDMSQLIGLAVAATFAFSFASLLFFGLVGVAAVCGLLCGIYVLREGINQRNTELNLMEECYQLEQKQSLKINKFQKLLSHFLKLQDDKCIRQKYNQIAKNENVNQCVRDIIFYLKFNEEPSDSGSEKQVTPNDSYWLSHVIAFFSGFGWMLGIGASIIGVAPLAGLLFVPAAGASIFGVIVLLSLVVGIAAVYADYCVRQSQQNHINKLEEEKHELFVANKRLDKTMLRIQSCINLLPSSSTNHAVEKSSVPALMPQQTVDSDDPQDNINAHKL